MSFWEVIGFHLYVWLCWLLFLINCKCASCQSHDCLVWNVYYFCRCSSLCFIKPHYGWSESHFWISVCGAAALQSHFSDRSGNSRVSLCCCLLFCNRDRMVFLFLTAKHSVVGIQVCFCIHLLHAERCRGIWKCHCSSTAELVQKQEDGVLVGRSTSYLGFVGILGEFSRQTATNPVC